jgi:hypothetical protein
MNILGWVGVDYINLIYNMFMLSLIQKYTSNLLVT